LTDFRYVLEVKKKLKGIQLVCYKKSFYDTVLSILIDEKVRILAIDPDHLTVTQYKQLNRSVKSCAKLIKSQKVVERFRQQKDAGELKLIKKALSIHKSTHHYLKRIVKPGISEFEILRKLENYVKSKDVGFSFEPIIASGPNSCYPHAKVTHREIRNNELVLIDMGIDVFGYKSDLTRMFFLGKIPELIWDVERKVREAQRRAISVIKPGIMIGQVDDQARNYLKENKLDSYFGHALGHGVGLDIHEDPRIGAKNTNKLEENMVITIEPAVYLPNKFGIRIEDMVLVTNKGCKILSDDIY